MLKHRKTWLLINYTRYQDVRFLDHEKANVIHPIYYKQLLDGAKYQSHYIEVTQEDIFMEQNMRFGLILGRLAILKKNGGPIMSNIWGWFFHVFRGKKKFKILFKNCSIRTKTLHKMIVNIFCQNIFLKIQKMFL